MVEYCKINIKGILRAQIVSSVIVVILLINPSFNTRTTSINRNNQSNQANKDTIILSLNAAIIYFNPLFSNSAYDSYEHTSAYLTLGLATTPNNDPTFTHWQVYPFLAQWWNSSTDYLTWFVNLHPGLTWQDGSPLTSTNVQFGLNATLDPATGSGLNATLDPATGSPSTGSYLDLFNNTAFSSPSPAGVQAHAITIINATTFVIHFARFDPYQEANVAGILPIL